MKHLLVKPINLFVFLISVTFLNSCKRELSNQQDFSDLKFELTKKIDLWLQNQLNYAGDSAVANIQRIRKNLQFSKGAIEKFSKNESLVIIPIDRSFKTESKNSNSDKFLVVILKEDGSFRRVNVVEILPSVELAEKTKKDLIPKVYKGNLPEFDCLFSIYSIGSRLAYAIEYRSGKIYSQKFPQQVKRETNNAGKQIESCTIIDWYLVTHINGVEISRVYLYSTSIGDCGGGCEPTMIQCGPGGSGGGEEYIIVSVDSVKKQVSNPCLNSILNKITDPKLKGEVVKLFQQTYVGWGGNVTLKFIEVNDLRDQDGNPQFAGSFLTGQIWNININNSFTGYTSKEYMGVAILHEIVHSFIELYQNNTSVPLTEFDHHKIIFEKWINQLRDAMIEIFNLSSADATALALQGLDDVLVKEIGPNQFAFEQQYNNFSIEKYGTSLYAARTISDQYEAGTKGVKCQ